MIFEIKLQNDVFLTSRNMLKTRYFVKITKIPYFYYRFFVFLLEFFKLKMDIYIFIGYMFILNSFIFQWFKLG